MNETRERMEVQSFNIMDQTEEDKGGKQFRRKELNCEHQSDSKPNQNPVGHLQQCGQSALKFVLEKK